MNLRIGASAGRAVPAVAGAIGAPAVVTSLALYEPGVSTSAAAMAYVVAVVTAAAVGGVRAGLAASALSFAGLNYYFTEPRNSFDIGLPSDVIAGFVFLAVSVTVGTVLSAALEQRARAERREQEAELMHALATTMLEGRSADAVLRRLADALCGLLDLSGCSVRATVAGKAWEASAGILGGGGETVPITGNNGEIGSIRVSARRGRLTGADRAALAALADQTAVALDGMELADHVRRAELEAQTSKARAALFSSVTHDLRTPLASILASATSLREGAPGMTEDHRRELLDTIRHEAERLNRLVGNLMQLSRLRAGALTPAKVPAALDEIVHAVVARMRSHLAGHEIEVAVGGDLPEVAVDVVQIDQALTNLLENAVRFAPPRTRIAVRATAGNGAIAVAVSDRGPGIPPEERERVFEPFVRGSGSNGTGLGLAIAKAVVEAHGGRIGASETDGGGATITFELPVAGP